MTITPAPKVRTADKGQLPMFETEAPSLLGTRGGITVRQLELLKKLAREAQEITGADPANTAELVAAFIERWAQMTTKEASEEIGKRIHANRVARANNRTAPKATPNVVPKTSSVVVPVGFYRYEDSVAEVVVGKSGNPYAKVLDLSDWKFHYAPGVIRKLTTDAKLTVEAAAALGHLHDRCMLCGHRLDKLESRQRGIGPVCAGKL